MATKHNITVSPEFPAARGIIENITTNGRPADATVIYEGSRNQLFYLEQKMPSNNPEGIRVNVKAFRVPPFPNDYIYSTLRAGKAARSYEFARRLLSLGFHTPTPFGYSEIHQGVRITDTGGIWPRLTHSYYFCEHIPYPAMRCWEARPDRNELIGALGAEIARLHAAGVWMKDFSTGNILVQSPAESPDGTYRFHYVDLNRTAFGITDRRQLMQMFNALSCSREFTLEIAAAYARASGRDLTTVLNEAGEAFDTFQKRTERKQHIKQLFRSLFKKS